jgi:hypothetical protein
MTLQKRYKITYNFIFFSRGRYEFEEQPVKKRTSDVKVCEVVIGAIYILTILWSRTGI